MLELKQLIRNPPSAFSAVSWNAEFAVSVVFRRTTHFQVPPAFGDKPCFEVVPALFSRLFWIASDALGLACAQVPLIRASALQLHGAMQDTNAHR
jgi:hypothetical protein